MALFRLAGLSKRRIIEPSVTAFMGLPFALVFTYTLTECVILHHEVHELDGNNYEFWKTLGYSLKCVLELVASTSPESSFKGTPLDWALANVSLRRLRFSVALSG